MSETQLIENLPILDDKGITQPTEIDVDEDLEDGEIDDDDDDVVVVQATPANINDDILIVNSSLEKPQTQQHDTVKLPTDSIVTIDLVQEHTPTPPPVKSKKPHPLEDDHASSIENAIASALKKKGIEPPMPKIMELRNGQQDGKEEGLSSQTRSSRRRKRKKQRDEKEKERKGKKRQRYESPDPDTKSSKFGPPPLEDEDDMDEFEMLNVRGGSPPPPTSHSTLSALHSFKDQFDSVDDSYSSYESYDSGDGGAGIDSNRRRRRAKKDCRKRRDRGNGRNRDDDRSGRQEKRNRRDSADEKHRQEPRKLELCKFYLMECCAKKDKCSYMHSDFPCKFHYLGMDCPNKETCKFSHGEPLSEQLRNILLKHLETAPKEILGNNFKRISRDNAISQVTKRHEILCKQYGVEITWTPITNLGLSHNRRGGDQMHYQHQQQQLQQLQQQQLQQQPQNPITANIPSLLDMVINPPPMGDGDTIGVGIGGILANPAHGKNNDKHRKSRWADTMSSKRNSYVEPSTSAPSYLDVKNLTGILSEEHIEKLSQLGIVNLEQVNQLTFGQLNEIGLTIAEISEIQLNAINMSKQGVSNGKGGASSAVTDVEGKVGSIESDTTIEPTVATANTTDSLDSIHSNRDVDMRFIPSAETSQKDVTSIDKTTIAQAPEKDLTMSSNSSSNSSSGVVMVDYSQYLKDSNLSFDRNDAYDDEKDEEQLIIDDGNLDTEEYGTAASSTDLKDYVDEKKTNNSFDNVFSQEQHRTDTSTALRNPFNPPYTGENKKDPRENCCESSYKQNNAFKTSQDDENEGDNTSDELYFASRATLSRSRTPTPSQSDTSQSPEPQEPILPAYERSSMYDLCPQQAQEEAKAAESMKEDKDMRFFKGGSGPLSDIDLRLPFQPILNYTPATEIDCSITSHLPMTYKVYEIVVPKASYMQLRKNFKSGHTSDPRLRRILGLPELSQTTTSAALNRSVRKLSNSIASPESEGASPKYYTPPSGHSFEERKTVKSTAIPQLRLDPRRAAAAQTAAVIPNSISTSTTSSHSSSANAMKQNVEIRNLLQKSDWYKNLNSKFKIMVNQQLALVSTELKKFHQDSSPNKIFDITFIVSNSTLQQILTHLGIYIDDNGEVAHVDADTDEQNVNLGMAGIALPNLSQPPPQQLDFLRAPPPNMPNHGGSGGPLSQQMYRAGMAGPPPMNMPPFVQAPNGRPSLLGLPPGAPGNPFNPFAGNIADVGMNPNFLAGPVGGPGLMGPGPLGFGNFAPQNMQQQRNFGPGNQQRNHHQRAQANRRNNNTNNNNNNNNTNNNNNNNNNNSNQ